MHCTRNPLCAQVIQLYKWREQGYSTVQILQMANSYCNLQGRLSQLVQCATSVYIAEENSEHKFSAWLLADSKCTVPWIATHEISLRSL